MLTPDGGAHEEFPAERNSPRVRSTRTFSAMCQDGECCCCYHPCACWKLVSYAILAVAAIIVTVVLIVCSFQWVEVGFYGLDVNYVVQIVELITSRTKDGLSLTLGITLQYELIRNSLPALYRLLNTEYIEILMSTSRDVVRDVASHWRAVEFFRNRSAIEYDLRASLEESFDKVHARCTDVQLKSIDLPAAFETSIEQTEVARQDIEKAVFELGLNLTTTATADAAATLATLSEFSPSDLIRYMYIQALQAHSTGMLTVGLEPPLSPASV
ncbi:hypothetical protein PAPYR_9058 [Paratrimastix pyriformis]|uniref:Prohibitin n=1 Tax=Paratrimastix pyriformis TaxID=342808 RepID=A0ABQ8UEU4_9EUKA|nr:hypothetical protein PAPYR_9058 [Paratrimastix pyriformis]